MAGQDITGPDGRMWKVRRRWTPRVATTLWDRVRHRFKKTVRNTLDLGDVGGGCTGDLAEGFFILLAVIAVVALLVFVVVPLITVVVDLLILLVIAVLGLVGRVLFRRPWIIDAVADDGERRRWKVVGWRASGEARAVIAQELQVGMDTSHEKDRLPTED